MRKRDFLKTAAAGAIGSAAIAAPAIAQSAPTIRWRLVSSFPKNIDVLYGSAEVMAKNLAEAVIYVVKGTDVRHNPVDSVESMVR